MARSPSAVSHRTQKLIVQRFRRKSFGSDWYSPWLAAQLTPMSLARIALSRMK